MRSKIGGSLKFCQDLKSALQNFKKVGYDFAELNLGLPLEPNKDFEDKIRSLSNIMPILTAHLPGIDYSIEEIERCKKFIEILSDLGTRLYVIHLYSPNLRTKDNFNLKMKKLNDLADFAKSRKSVLVLENTEEDPMSLSKAIDEIPYIDYCLDIGHANLVNDYNSLDYIHNFEKRLKHIHIHDNDGGDSVEHDKHLPIGEGQIKFKPIFEKLKEIDYSGNITLELYNANNESKKLSIKRVRELMSR